ncbi:MAG: HAMP domain-containing sensor histidine kinase [Oscillospiraceae bacterium]|jgi:signal transduction histidine kinase
MSIYRKMLVYTSTIIIVPMIIILFLSSTVLDNQINQSAENYMKEAFVIANNLLSSRLSEMGRLSASITDTEFKETLQTGDRTELTNALQNTCEVYDYLNFYILYDSDKRLVINKPNIQDIHSPRLERLLEKAESEQPAVTSVEAFKLDDLFDPDSESYQKYRVYISDERTYLDKCLAAVSAYAIRGSTGNILGYLVFGSVLNNDSYFPSAYSKSVQNSYLAISVDGIRIASNISSPASENYIGSTMPVSVSTLEGTNDVYFGRKEYGGEIHVFLDKMISNCDGESVGTIGVGIPEKKFMLIANTQKGIVVTVPLIFLVVILFFLRFAAKRIARPIVKATALADQISQGNTNVDIDVDLLADSRDEGDILLRALKKMADTISKNREDILAYLRELEKSREEQHRLSQELLALNETLEKKVEIRTQDLREAIDGLEKSGQYKTQFLSHMSHELRTPLSSIISCTEILKDEIFGPLNEKQIKYIGNIAESSEQLQQLINSILDTTKIEAGKMTLDICDCTISEIVQDSLRIVDSIAYKKNIRIENDMQVPDLAVRLDYRKTKQALCNILSNSIKFTPKDGKIEIATSQIGDLVRIIITDTGIGIKKEDLLRVFNEFEQADNSYEREYEGTGLGLPLAKKFVEMQGGTIYLTSELGSGTRVVITLPIRIGEDDYRDTV